MNPLIQTYRESEEDFVYDVTNGLTEDEAKELHRQSLITFVEAQIEMLEGMRMKWPEPEPLTICIADGYNQALTDIITEYKEFLKEIKE